MQRLSIARAMMHDPEVLFLDEPSAGLDPQTRLLLWEIVREYNARGQDDPPDDAQHGGGGRACARASPSWTTARIIALGTPAELKGSIPGGFVVRLQFHPRSPATAREARSVCPASRRCVPSERTEPTCTPTAAGR